MALKDIARTVAPSWAMSAYHFLKACVAALYFGFPSRHLCVIGVTGTDGKSTTAEMIARVLNEAGMKTALSSSVHFLIGKVERENTMKMSMPGPFTLQRFLREAVRERCTHAVVEVSSEGVAQHRQSCVAFHTAVVTNVYPEHIERHGSFEAYREAKGRFVRGARNVRVLNGEDEQSNFFLRFPAERVYVFGAKDISVPARAEKVIATNIEESPQGVTFNIRGVPFCIHLLGWVNAYNAAAAVCVALSQGVSLKKASEALGTLQRVPGRMEQVAAEPFAVLVDYAVTPNALRNLYETARRIWKPSRMICVLGACGGGRDRWKRQKLGEIAGRFCDAVVLADEDPFDENPGRIVSEIRYGITNHQDTSSKPEVWEVLDRREAIRKAFSLARTGDLVVLSGKGSENSIMYERGKKIPWNECEVAREELRSHSSMDRAQPSEG